MLNSLPNLTSLSCITFVRLFDDSNVNPLDNLIELSLKSFFFPTHFQKCINLRSLRLVGEHGITSLPLGVFDLRYLTDLSVTGCCLYDARLQRFSNLTRLSKLELSSVTLESADSFVILSNALSKTSIQQLKITLEDLCLLDCVAAIAPVVNLKWFYGSSSFADCSHESKIQSVLDLIEEFDNPKASFLKFGEFRLLNGLTVDDYYFP